MTGTRPPEQAAAIVINIAPVIVDDPTTRLIRLVQADPCAALGHRPAWLNTGGVACGRCGTPL